MQTAAELVAELVAGDAFGFERMAREHPEGGRDLVLIHLELMRDAGEPIPAPLLALEAIIRRG